MARAEGQWEIGKRCKQRFIVEDLIICRGPKR